MIWLLFANSYTLFAFSIGLEGSWLVCCGVGGTCHNPLRSFCHPVSTVGCDVVCSIINCTAMGVNIVMLLALANSFVLRKELEAFKVGMMSTIFAGCPLLCHCPFCSVAAAVCPSGIWNIFV